jgi:hypothetical protein
MLTFLTHQRVEQRGLADGLHNGDQPATLIGSRHFSHSIVSGTGLPRADSVWQATRPTSGD